MKVIMNGIIDKDMVEINKDTFRTNLNEVINRIMFPLDKYDININYSNITINKSSRIGIRYHRFELDTNGKFRIVLESDVTKDFVRIGKIIFKKCDSCPLTDEEIVSLLASKIIEPIMGFFDDVNVEFEY